VGGHSTRISKGEYGVAAGALFHKFKGENNILAF
jgi:hypothetical protein